MSASALQDKDETRHRTIGERFRDALLSGLAVVVPVLVTVMVVGYSVNFLSGLLDPVVVVVDSLFPELSISGPMVKLGILGAGTAVVLVTGVLVQQAPSSGPFKRQFDSALARVPGIGTVYTSFVDISETFLGADTDSFESVMLIEYDEPDVYAIAFRTSETPETIRDAADCAEMETLFVPSAPNPMLGGEVLYVSSDRVVDIDMTVAEGVRAVVTSGAASDDGRRHSADVEVLQEDGS